MVAQIDRQYARHGIIKLTRRLTSYALFEGRPHTTRGQWFNPVVFTLLKGLNSLPGEPTLEAPIFITGLGRSGTTILGVLLSLHKSVGFLNEPKAVWSVIDARHDVNGDYTRTGGRFRLYPADALPEIRRTAHRLFGRYLALVGAQRLVDKYPELVFRIDYLLALFPDARILFITRRGEDAIASIENWSERLGVQVGERVDDWWGRGDVKWTYLRDEILQGDAQYESVQHLLTKNLDNRHRAALEWIATMREGVRQHQAHPDCILRVDYEALVSQPESSLAAIFRHCQLSADPAVLAYAKEKLYANPPKSGAALRPEVQALFEETTRLLAAPSTYRRQP